MIEQRLAGTDGLKGDQFTRNQVRRLVFQNRHYGGELWRDELVAYCNANPTMIGSSGPVDVSDACPALAGWDLRVNLDSTGALLFVRFMDKFGARARSRPRSTSPTRSTRRSGSTPPTARRARRSPTRSPTCARRTSRSTPPTATIHYELRGSERIPIHGGEGGQGVFNAISDGWRARGRLRRRHRTARAS